MYGKSMCVNWIGDGCPLGMPLEDVHEYFGSIMIWYVEENKGKAVGQVVEGRESRVEVTCSCTACTLRFIGNASF